MYYNKTTISLAPGGFPLPKSRSTAARRSPAHNPQDEAAYVYNLLALLDRLDRDDLLMEKLPNFDILRELRSRKISKLGS
jgi:hypothetical protein